MQIDDKIYPINVEISTDDFDYTKNFGEFTLNEKIDNNIVYSSSSSAYADLLNKVVFSWYYTNKGKYKIIENCGKYNYQSVMLTLQNAGGIFSYATANQSYSTMYDNRFGYGVESLNNYYNNNVLIRGFKYYSLCACIYVEYFTSDGNASTNIVDLNTFDTNYSDKKIRRIILTCYSGTNSGRTSTSIQFSNYNDYVIPFFTLPNALDETNYNITHENIINYFPRFYSSSDVKNRGLTIIGGIVGGSYLTTNITTPAIKGECYNRSNYTGLNWENVTDVTYNTTNIATFMPDFTYNKSDILAMAATYGILFSDKEDIAKNIDLTKENNLLNENLYFPIIESSGLWQGRYTHGNENKNTEQYKNDWNSDKNAPFVNGSPPVSDDEILGDDNFSGIVSNTSGFVHRYFVNHSEMKQIATYLNNTDTDLLSSIVKNISMSGDNPINSITSIMYTPISFDFKAVGDVIIGCNYVNIGTSENPVALGANVIDRDNYTIELGEMFIQPTFKNYLDYEPYTKYIAYIPFCNFVELESNIITNKTLKFTMFFDLITGTCECAIRVNGLLYKSVSGNFATQCSIQGYDNSTYSANAMASTGKMVGGAGAVISAAITGNLLVGAAGVASYLSGLYDFATTPKTYESSGKSTGLLTQNYPLHVCVYRLAVSDISDENYGNFIGYACEFSEKLANLSGLTVCANAYVECNATNTEKEKIKELLESGVYI